MHKATVEVLQSPGMTALVSHSLALAIPELP
jgi:hypothetical protein